MISSPSRRCQAYSHLGSTASPTRLGCIHQQMFRFSNTPLQSHSLASRTHTLRRSNRAHKQRSPNPANQPRFRSRANQQRFHNPTEKQRFRSRANQQRLRSRANQQRLRKRAVHRRAVRAGDRTTRRWRGRRLPRSLGVRCRRLPRGSTRRNSRKAFGKRFNPERKELKQLISHCENLFLESVYPKGLELHNFG